MSFIEPDWPGSKPPALGRSLLAFSLPPSLSPSTCLPVAVESGIQRSSPLLHRHLSSVPVSFRSTVYPRLFRVIIKFETENKRHRTKAKQSHVVHHSTSRQDILHKVELPVCIVYTAPVLACPAGFSFTVALAFLVGLFNMGHPSKEQRGFCSGCTAQPETDAGDGTAPTRGNGCCVRYT